MYSWNFMMLLVFVAVFSVTIYELGASIFPTPVTCMRVSEIPV
jgi:hypothetical protein